jgi:hypothetical protein
LGCCDFGRGPWLHGHSKKPTLLVVDASAIHEREQFASMQRLTLQFITLPKTPGIAKENGLRQKVLCPGHQQPVLARFEAPPQHSMMSKNIAVGAP